MRKAFLLAAVFIVGAVAQSVITGGQLRRGSQTPDQILAVDGSGRFYYLRLGPGVSIVSGELRIAPTPPPQQLFPDPAGTHPNPTGRISRNGLVQTPEIDYRIINNRAVPVLAWDPTDVVSAF